jgi:hypothetical protein
LRHRDVGTVVQHFGRQTNRFGKLAERRQRHLREAVMAHRHQMTFHIGGKPQLLHRARPIPV